MWSIFFALPNLGVRESLGNENIAIVPCDDSRVQEIISSSLFAKSFVEGFEDQFRRKIHPSLLIVSNDASDYIREIDAIVGFRNAIAISTIIKGHEHRLTSTFTAYPLYSDFFDFYPITISKDDDGFITSSPSVLDYDNELHKFRGQSSPSLAGPGHLSVKPDDILFNSLQKAWERRYIKRMLYEWSTLALFRSLEMAYQASAMPFKNHSTIYDYGSSASLWVSALEILSHPRKGKAHLLSVLDLLARYDWSDKVVKRTAYKIKYKGQVKKINLPQKLYKELYDTRNDFLHGNPVRENRLHPFKSLDVPHITRFAPLIYKVALLCYLVQFKDRRKKTDWQKDYISKLFNERELAEAILKAKGRQ